MAKDFMMCQSAEEFLREFPRFEEVKDDESFYQRENALRRQAEKGGISGLVWAVKLHFPDKLHYFVLKNLKDSVCKKCKSPKPNMINNICSDCGKFKIKIN